MPVTREEYQKLVAREMRRYGRGSGTGGETSRDKAVRAANVAAGYGNSTALKYPVKAGGGGRTLRRDGDGDGKAGEGGGGGGKGPGGGKGSDGGYNAGPGRGQSPGGPELFPVGPGRGRSPGGPRLRQSGGPGRLSDENAGPGTGPDITVVMPPRLEGVPFPLDRMPPSFTPGLATPPSYTPGVSNAPATRSVLPGPQDMPGTDIPVGPGDSAPTHSNFTPPAGFSIGQLLEALQGGVANAGRQVAPWLQGKMFGG